MTNLLFEDGIRVRPPEMDAPPAPDVDVYFETLDRVDDTLDELERLCRDFHAETPVTSASPKRPLGRSPGRSVARPARTAPPYFIPPLSFTPPAGFMLSVVIPVFNEAKTIERVLDRVFKLPVDKEVIVVDDGSTDRTARVLRSQLGRPGLRVVFKEKNQGKGAALRDGFAAAKGDIVVVQDADMEYDPRDIPKLLEAILLDGADVAYGSRYLSNSDDSSRFHRFGNALLTQASNLLTGLKITDMETCYKAFKRRVLRGINLRQNRFGFEPEITAKVARAGWRIREVPIGYKARGYAEGKKIRLKDAFNAFYCIARYAIYD